MTVYAETLNLAMELITAETLAKDRVALIAVDHLAELLLHRHADRVFANSEGSKSFPRQQYPQTERKRIHNGFARMSRLAQRRAHAPWGRTVEPILSKDDATLFRIAHDYRNATYHEDRHNQAVLSPLTVLFAQAVGRAFVAGYPDGNGTSITQADATALTRLGCTIEHDSFITNLPALTYRDGAQQIVNHAVASWDVDFTDFREHLADDILHRALTAGRVLVGLAEGGMPEEEIDLALWTSQFWDLHGADDELLRLDQERLDHPEDAAASKAYLDHLRGLQTAFRPTVKLRWVPRFEQRAKSLGKAKTMTILLDRYAQLDAEIRALDHATGEAVDVWERAADA